MAKVTNTHRITPIGLPSGLVILPGASEDVPDWEEVKKRQNIAFYVNTGVLVAEAKKKAQPQTQPLDEAAQKQALINELAALGVPAGPDASLEELQAALTAKKAEQQ